MLFEAEDIWHRLFHLLPLCALSGRWRKSGTVIRQGCQKQGSAAIWHLSKVLKWFKAKGNYAIEDSLIDLSNAAMQGNIARQMQDLEPAFHRNIKALLT